MSTVLNTIVYVSTATRPMSDADLEALLVQARDLNLQHQITGLLLYADGNFMQCLEGPEPAVTESYERIKTSQRHKNLRELMNEPVAERSFPHWQMALAHPTGSTLLALSTALWKRASTLPEPAPTPTGLTLMRQFWADARRGARQQTG